MSGFQMPITIGQAMEYINNNHFLLPAFQRDFVWKPEQIERLFDSLMRDYPTSSMLFWKVEGETKTKWKFYKFLDRFILDATDKNTANQLCDTSNLTDFFAILDGQQRLTAMRLGLFGKYAYHEKNKSWTYNPNSFPFRTMYLNLSQTGGPNDDCLYIFEFKKDSETGCKIFYTDNNGCVWFQVGAIVGYHNSGEMPEDYFMDFSFTKEQRKILNLLDKTIFQKTSITYFEEDEQKPDKAVKIFTRINSGGTYLSFANIVFSIMVSNWTTKDAKTEIKSLIELVAQKGFTIDEDYIVKAFLYLFHKNVKTEISSFTVNFCKVIESNWEKIRDAITSLFDLLRSYGLNFTSLTSNNATLPILYYIFHMNIYEDFTDKVAYKQDRENIKKWLYSMIIRKQFGRATDSVLQQSRKAFTNDIETDYIKNVSAFDGDRINKNINGYDKMTDETLNDILGTQKDDRYAFTILSLLYPDLDYKNNNFHKDHLHPVKAYDNLPEPIKARIPYKVYNSIINLQMLDKNENESKGEMPLEKWVDKMCPNETNKDVFLKSHIIPDVDLSLANIEDFISKRKDMLKSKLLLILN